MEECRTPGCVSTTEILEKAAATKSTPRTCCATSHVPNCLTPTLSILITLVFLGQARHWQALAQPLAPKAAKKLGGVAAVWWPLEIYHQQPLALKRRRYHQQPLALKRRRSNHNHLYRTCTPPSERNRYQTLRHAAKHQQPLALPFPQGITWFTRCTRCCGTKKILPHHPLELQGNPQQPVAIPLQKFPPSTHRRPDHSHLSRVEHMQPLALQKFPPSTHRRPNLSHLNRVEHMQPLPFQIFQPLFHPRRVRQKQPLALPLQ